MQEITAINQEICRLTAERRKFEAANFKERIIPTLTASIGKTFVYRNNSYGSGGRWDTYRKLCLIAPGEINVWLIFEEVQLDCDGAAKLETAVELVRADDVPLPLLTRNWTECASIEYEARREITLRELANPVLRQKSLTS